MADKTKVKIVTDSDVSASYASGTKVAKVGGTDVYVPTTLDQTTVCDAWAEETTYAKDVNCVYNGKLYVSLQAGNKGHIPGNTADTGWWNACGLFSHRVTSEVSVDGILNNAELEKSVKVCVEHYGESGISYDKDTGRYYFEAEVEETTETTEETTEE